MTELISLVSALAWPLTVIWLAHSFRNELRGLLHRLSKIKYKDAEATFEETLKTAEVQAASLPLAVPLPLENAPSSEPSELDTRIAQLYRIAEVSPRAAILEAWALVEAAAGKSGFVQGASRPLVNPLLFVDWLIREGRIPAESAELMRTLKNLRNQAAHLPDWQVTFAEAERYLRLAAQISLLIVDPV